MMDTETKYFIEKNIDLIEDNNWDTIYERALDQVAPLSLLTEALLDAGIDPLEHLNYIPEYYMNMSNRREFSIPRNIKSIKENAFNFCTNLTSINYEGTMKEWDEIEKEQYWDNGAAIKIIKCSDGERLHS